MLPTVVLGAAAAAEADAADGGRHDPAADRVPPVVIAAGLAQLQGSAPQWLVTLWFNHPLTGADADLRRPGDAVHVSRDRHRRARDRPAHARRRLAQPRRLWFTTLARVILPNVETAVLGAMFLTIALCLGEVVIATILLYMTLPGRADPGEQRQSQAGISVALSMLSARCSCSCCSSRCRSSPGVGAARPRSG